MDVVWLKRDVRLHDHAPLRAALTSSSPILILFVYEPDQLSHASVHGSHILFQNEALDAFNATFSSRYATASPITFLHAEMPSALDALHAHRPIVRLLAHQETGHLASFARDRRVRAWCAARAIPFVEYPQTGVARPLRDRDHFTALYNRFISQPECDLPPAHSLPTLAARLVTDAPSCGPLPLSSLPALSPAHAHDRPARAKGGEHHALAMLDSFLRARGEAYARGISSPNTAWSAGSRLSPYLAFGHVSVRRVANRLAARQTEARAARKRASRDAEKDGWLKSLAAFHSRLRWRAHFMQKLEMQPDMEAVAQCKPLDDVRRAEGDWDERLFTAWAAGRTGFPMVDACMRCLLEHGWVNFRMRAMLVSFACYQLWLDWRGIAGHLARVFLDYEPGIHYPQLQMQAGVTGINAMRVYGVTKQAREQDPDGRFIRRYVSELRKVPTRFIHEPWGMDARTRKEAGVEFGEADGCYPRAIVDEHEAGRRAKSKMQSVRGRKETKEAAKAVYQKHGSRAGPMGGRKRKAGGGVRAGEQTDGKKQKLISAYCLRSGGDARLE